MFSSKKNIKLVSLFFLMAFLLSLLLVFPFVKDFHFTYDEGYDLMKPLLISRGYDLSAIWNDQPVILTYLLQLWMNCLGYNLLAGRLFFFCCSLLIVFCSVIIVKDEKRISGTIFTIMAIFSIPSIREVFSSALIVTPSLAFSLISLYLLRFLSRKNFTIIIVSSLLFALACGSKLLALSALPAIFYLIWQNSLSGKNRILNFLIFMVINLLFLQISLAKSQLFASHLEFYQDFAIANRYLFVLIILQPYLVLSLLKVFSVPLDNLLKGFIIWFITVIIIFIFHKPLWFHYNIYFSIPLILINGLLFNKSYSKKYFYNFSIFLLLLIFFYYNSVKEGDEFKRDVSLEKNLNIAVKWFKDNNYVNKFIITDLPVLALRTENLVYPELCVFSYKRVKTDKNIQEQIIRRLKENESAAVIFLRFNRYFLEDVYNYLAKNMEAVSIADGIVVYQKKLQ